MTEAESRAGRVLGGESFSFAEAIGGWRGLVESALPGVVYVTVFLITRTWLAPAIAALAVVAVLVIVRLLQRGQLTQAFSGVVGVAIGVVWAWRAGNATGFYGPGLVFNVGLLLACLVSILARWPIAGVVMGLVHGTGNAWRLEPAELKRAQLGTAVLAGLFALRLAVQLPLFLAEQTAALGVAKLVMGTPLFALTLWVVWLVVRNVGRKPESQDLPQQT